MDIGTTEKWQESWKKKMALEEERRNQKTLEMRGICNEMNNHWKDFILSHLSIPGQSRHTFAGIAHRYMTIQESMYEHVFVGSPIDSIVLMDNYADEENTDLRESYREAIMAWYFVMDSPNVPTLVWMSEDGGYGRFDVMSKANLQGLFIGRSYGYLMDIVQWWIEHETQLMNMVNDHDANVIFLKNLIQDILANEKWWLLDKASLLKMDLERVIY